MAKTVTVYSTPACPYCHMAKEYFDKKNVKYTDHDVAKDEKARDEMLEKSGQMGVPVITIGEKVIIGFNKAAIDEALAE
jgi:glutaredoxin 3